MNKREYKNMPIEVKEMSEEDDFFIFKGYASTFGNIDRQGDVISKGAFIESLKNIEIAMLWQHNHSEPIGVFTKAYEDDKGLYVEGKMPKDDDFVNKRVMPQVRIGSVKSMSIGFTSKDYEYESAKNFGGEEGKSVRVIKSMELFETSLVTIPANPEAVMHEFKSLKMLDDIELDEEVRKDIKLKLEKRIEEQSAQLDIKDVGDIECMKDIENILKVRAGLSQSERKILISRIKAYSREVGTGEQDSKVESEKLDSWAKEYEIKQLLKDVISRS